MKLAANGFIVSGFDVLLMSRDVLDYISKTNAVLAVNELCRITRPEGIVIFTLDSLDEEYESEPYIVNADDDYVFTNGKWNGLSPIRLRRGARIDSGWCNVRDLGERRKYDGFEKRSSEFNKHRQIVTL